MPRVRRCKYNPCKVLVEYPDYFCELHKQYEAEYKTKRETNRKEYYKSFNKRVRNHNLDSNARNKFYHSTQWKYIRRAVLNRDYFTCQYCKANGVLTTDSKTVDHIVPFEYDGQLKDDMSNLATICRQCHKKKTDWEQSYYGTGKANKRKNVSEIRDINYLSKLINKN